MSAERTPPQRQKTWNKCTRLLRIKELRLFSRRQAILRESRGKLTRNDGRASDIVASAAGSDNVDQRRETKGINH